MSDMKYIILVGDGMADYPLEELGGRTPLEAAKTTHMDFIAREGILGRVKTIPEGMTPASDVANLSILGYDPAVYYSGRGPLEAANIGVELEENDVVFRCNLITFSGDTLVDYSAGHISTKEARQLIASLNDSLGNERIRFYPGVSYRHIMVVKQGSREALDKLRCFPPHDIIGKSISRYLPQGRGSDLIIKLMQDSIKVLQEHEINQVRVDLKENPANMIWLWGQGKKPNMPQFLERFGLKGAVISAVDLLKGAGRVLGLEVINVPTATGYYDTDYEGKAKAALRFLEKGDFVFLHVEAPDEAGHNGDLREKILAIERFDSLVVGTIMHAYRRKKNFRLLVLPDHATPLSVKTHTPEPVCFGMYGKDVAAGNFAAYSEKEAQKSNLYFEQGHKLMDYFLHFSKE